MLAKVGSMSGNMTEIVVFGGWRETMRCTFISYDHMHNFLVIKHYLLSRIRKNSRGVSMAKTASISPREGIVLRESNVVDRNDGIGLAAVSALLAA